MTEHDDDVSRRYRALPREEPPAAIDEAILAASRRALAVSPVARAGGLRRWSGPLSIAAVLVLATGVVMKMQVEQPGIETSLPVEPARQERSPPKDSREQLAPPSAAQPQPATATPAAPAASVAPVAPIRARQEKRVVAAPEPELRAPEQPPPLAPLPMLQSRPQPRQTITTNAAAAPAPAAFAPEMAKRAARDTSTEDVASRPVESPEATLERIARLRREGHHVEADRALEEFRRQNPDFRIPEATWEQVRPRSP